MKTVLFIFLLCQFQAFSQCDSSEEIVNSPHLEAEFPGGTSEMMKFIQENIEYPEIERCSMGQFSGRIYIEFIVCSDGTIRDVTCKKGCDCDTDDMVIKLVEKMPNWIPAEINHQAVSSKCRLPITICLQ